MPEIKIDSGIRALIPPISKHELSELERSIQEEGCRDPLIVWAEENVLIDGHNRYEICDRLGLPYQAFNYSFKDRVEVEIWMRRNQVARRNLTEDQRSANAAKLVLLETEQSKRERARKAGEVGGKTAGRGRPKQEKEIGSVADVSPEPIETAEDKPKKPRQRTRIAKEQGVPEKKVRKSLDIAKSDSGLLDRVESGEISLAAATREVKRKKVVETLESISAKETKKISGEYDVVVIDPPWPMEKIERDYQPDQVKLDYPTMSEKEILDIRIPAAKDCHLWLWTTHKFLPFALSVLEAWEFRYVCTFVWHKPGGFQPFNLPQYNAEFALYARKGSPQFIDTKAFPTCFSAPRGKHSEKPEEFYELVRRVTAGRKIDMFNRRFIEGFDSWGKEAAA